MLTFDEATHTYFWHGQMVPNVTRVLGPLTDWSRIPAETLERARQEGVAVHKMVELHCKDDLDAINLPAWMQGHYDAWLRFLAESGFEVWEAERRVFHPKLCYAGTLDLMGLFRRGDFSGEPSIIDLKRSFYAGPVIGLQLAAYCNAWNESLVRGDVRKVSGRYALQLRDDGSYRLQPYADRSDFTTYLACLTMWRWRQKHGQSS